MVYDYFIKCVSDDCIDMGVHEDDIISLEQFDFFNVLVTVAPDQAMKLVRYWRSEGINVTSFNNKDEPGSDKISQYGLLLTTIQTSQTRSNMMAAYAQSLTGEQLCSDG